MARSTIDFGIDLGTTNSSIAVLDGTSIHVIRNNENSETTPSVVGLQKNRLLVGRAAKERLDLDSKNTFGEFKLQMGSDTRFRFAASGREMRPEELSAEVLKSLRADVAARMGEEIRAALITVPAAFELPQCNATRKAAQLAGLQESPLLQEPVAAALTYGFQSESDKVFWLVYDFGGGTFDSAVIQVRDGEIVVVNHGGDNELGGKHIDWAIVEQLLVPAIVREHSLPDFRRGNPTYEGAIAKLKLRAEEAKIRLSRDTSAPIEIEFQDHRGRLLSFEYDLQREEVERLAEPFILRTLNICKRVLSEKGLSVRNIERVLLVGGPTLMPYLRERLADRTNGLGIPLEFRIDPLTIVAQGAAIAAGTMRIVSPPPSGGKGWSVNHQVESTFTISFPTWEFIGNDPEPVVSGIVKSTEGRSLQGYTVEFINADAQPQWRSGKIGVQPNGAFMTTLWAERGRANTFSLELRDSVGNLLPSTTDPERLTYTIAIVAKDPPLTHNVGVALVNNEVQWFIEKGTPLPARRRCVLRTIAPVRPGQTDDAINVVVLEGQNARANRNRRIGRLRIEAHKIKREIPVDSEVEITIEIDRSRIVRTSAFIPVLDEEFEDVLPLKFERSNPDELAAQFQREQERLNKCRQEVAETRDPQAVRALQRIDSEQIVQEVESSLAAAHVDPDAWDKCERSLLALAVAVDEVEDAQEWPLEVARAEKLLEAARDVIRDYGEADDRRALPNREDEVRRAIEMCDTDLLRQRVEQVRRLVFEVLDRKGILHVLYYQSLCEEIGQMKDPRRARELSAQGQQAIERGDVQALRAVNAALASLLPEPPPPPDPFGDGRIILRRDH